MVERICIWMAKKQDENPDDWKWQTPVGVWKVIFDYYPYVIMLALTIVTFKETA